MELVAGSDIYVWPTPYFFTYIPPDPNGSPLPSLNVDLRTIFRLRMHCSFRLKEYHVAIVYLQKENVQRVHILADNLNIDTGGALPVKSKITAKTINEITDIIEQITGYSRYENLSIGSQMFSQYPKLVEPTIPRDLKYNYVPLFTKEQVPGWLSFFCIRQFPNIYLIDDIIYLNLDKISNIRNYVQIFENYSSKFIAMLNYIEEKRIICTNDIKFVQDWELISLPAELIGDYKDILGQANGLFLPSFEESLDFWEKRLLSKPYYFYIGKSPIVAHVVSLKNPNIWIIDGWIELPMTSKRDYLKIKEIRKIMINSSGSIYLAPFSDKNMEKAKSYLPISITSYYLEERKEKVLSLLFPINEVPPEIDF